MTGKEEEEEEGEDGESQVIPSFQNAFNEALLSASVSVIAAQSGKLNQPLVYQEGIIEERSLSNRSIAYLECVQ